MLAFFGLTPAYKLDLHKGIFSLVTYGKGGWTWDAIYHQIPVYLRNFYINELSKSIQKENDAMKGTATNDTRPPHAVREAMKKPKKRK